MTDPSITMGPGGAQGFDPTGGGRTGFVDYSQAAFLGGGTDYGPPVKIRVRSRDRGRSDSLMPGYWNDEYGQERADQEAGQAPAELYKQLYRMNARDLDLLKRQMFLAGYYGLEALADGSPPQRGVIRAEDVEAWAALVDETYQEAAANPEGAISLEDRLAARIEGNREIAATGVLPGSGGYAEMEFLEPEQVLLTDQAAIRQIATKQATSLLGRELNPDEMNVIASVVSSQEYAHEIGKAQRSQNLKRAAISQRDAIQKQMRASRMEGLAPIDSSMAEPVVLDTSGPGSTTYQYGRALANKMGLQVMGETVKESPEDQTGGWTMTFSGDSARLEAMATWLQENGLVREITGQQVVGLDENGNPLVGTDQEGNQVTGQGARVMRVTFMGGAEAPGLGPLNGTPKNDLDAFTAAMKREGGSEIYTWEGSYAGDPGTLRGAYGISDTAWLAYSDKLGLDPNDHSVRNQDLVARTYAQDLYAKYGDWGIAGIAMRYGEGIANSYQQTYKAGGQWQNPKFDLDGEVQKIGTKMANYSTVDTAATIQQLEDEGFGFGGGQGGTLVFGGGVNVEQGFSVEARAQEELERRNAPEAQGYGTLQAFDVFSQIMGGATSLARGET